MQGFYDIEAWRQRRDEVSREAEASRLARRLDARRATVTLRPRRGALTRVRAALR